MIELEYFEEHLKTIKKEDWNKLFDLLEEIEKKEIFGELIIPDNLEEGKFALPFWGRTEIVEKFLGILYDIDLVIIFNWTVWKEGADILNNTEQDYNDINIVTLCKLLTAIIRADRFCDGTLIGNFENKNIEKILRALKNKLENNYNQIQ